MEPDEWRFAVLVSGAHGMDHFLKRIFPPLLPIWGVIFEFSLWKLGVILGALSFGAALGQIPAGHLSDRYDRRLLLPSGIAMMGLSCALVAWLAQLDGLATTTTVAGLVVSWQFVVLAVLLGLVGVGSSVLHPTGYPLISRNIDEVHSGTALGMWGSARSFGDALGPALVGIGLLVTDWHWVVLCVGGFGILYAIYLFNRLASYETQPAGFPSKPTTGPDESSFDWFRNPRQFLYPLLAVFASSSLLIIATSGATVFLPEFITSEYSYSFSVAHIHVTAESTASFYYSALLFAAGLAQLGTGRLTDRFDQIHVLLAFTVLGGVLLLGFGLLRFSPPVLLLVLVLLGATLWGLNPARDAIVSAIAPAGGEGRTFGYLWTGMLLIASISPAIVGYLGDITSLRQAFLWLTGFVFLSAIPIALLVSNRVYDGTRSRYSP